MTMFIQASARATYGIQVQTTDKPAILRMELIGIRIRQLCLCNGFCPLFHRLRRIQCIILIGEQVWFDTSVSRIPLVRNQVPVKKTYCAFWKKDNSGYYIEEFADILKSCF